MLPDISEAERIEGWMSAPELAWLAAAARTSPVIVEIGSWKGRSTKALAQHTPGIVYAIDHWQGEVRGYAEVRPEISAKGPDGLHAEFLRNLDPEIRAGKVVVLRSESGPAADLLRHHLDGRPVDMVFIDGDHTYAAVKRDIETYRPLLRDGGLLSGHDYSAAWPGVTLAVDELVAGRTVVPDASIWQARTGSESSAGGADSPRVVMDLEQVAIRRLERLGDVHRGDGRLEEARQTSERLLALSPGHVNAGRLLASLGGPLPEGTGEPFGLKPAPFVRIPGFLPPDVHDRMLEALVAAADRFEEAPIGRIDEHGGVRTELDGYLRRSAQILDCFRHLDAGLGRSFLERIATSFPMIRERLRVRPFDFQSIETRALRYRDGDFFRAHRDVGPRNTKRITFLYYVHATPRRFTGGDLVLFDTWFRPDLAPLEEPGYLPSRFTRIPCSANELVGFPSEFYHEALPVGGIGDDVRGARMAISGWFHTTAEDGDDRRLASTPY